MAYRPDGAGSKLSGRNSLGKLGLGGCHTIPSLRPGPVRAAAAARGRRRILGARISNHPVPHTIPTFAVGVMNAPPDERRVVRA